MLRQMCYKDSSLCVCVKNGLEAGKMEQENVYYIRLHGEEGVLVQREAMDYIVEAEQKGLDDELDTGGE